MKTLYLILILSYVTLLNAHSHHHTFKHHGTEEFRHECAHEEIQAKMEQVTLQPQAEILKKQGRIMEANPIDWHKLRIKLDYTLLDTFIASNPSFTDLGKMSKRVLENVKSYFEAQLQVKFYQTLTTTQNTCSGTVFPAVTDFPYDLHIMIQPEKEEGKNYFAAAGTCVYSDVDERPLRGIYYLNFVKMRLSKLDEYLYFSTFAHEFTHILGFSSSVYEKYKRPNGTDRPITETKQTVTISGKSYSAIILPEVVEYAKEYYNCPTLTYVPLENEGGTGSSSSHWDKVFLTNEYMNPTIESPGIISGFTMTLLKATYWYKVDENSAQPFDWGRDDGCDHFQICPQGKEYCATEDIGANVCTRDFTNKALCTTLESFLEGCNIIRSRSSTSCLKNLPDEITPDPEEIYGTHSRCFEWLTQHEGKTVSITQCHLAKCYAGVIYVKFKNGQLLICKKDYQIIKIDEKYNFRCPSLADFCSSWIHRCPLDCSGNGVCLKGNNCHCFVGFSGDDCSECSGCKKIDNKFILAAKFGGAVVLDDSIPSVMDLINGTTVLQVSLFLVFSLLFVLGNRV